MVSRAQALFLSLCVLLAGFGFGMRAHYELVEDDLTAPDTIRVPYEAASEVRARLHRCEADRAQMQARLSYYDDHRWGEAMGVDNASH